jgi:hypothetical protein
MRKGRLGCQPCSPLSWTPSRQVWIQRTLKRKRFAPEVIKGDARALRMSGLKRLSELSARQTLLGLGEDRSRSCAPMFPKVFLFVHTTPRGAS